MAEHPVIALVLTGRVREHAGPRGGILRTAIEKRPVDGPVALGPTGLAGDEVASTRVHGGPEKAVLAYAAAAYDAWRAEDGDRSDALTAGAFGENLLIAGLDEGTVCIGDSWSVRRGGAREPAAVLQVTQPRVPCGTPGRRWGRPGLRGRMGASGRTGWYLRVLRPGTLAAGDRLVLLARPHPEWTVLRAWRLAAAAARDAARCAALQALPELSADWKP